MSAPMCTPRSMGRLRGIEAEQLPGVGDNDVAVRQAMNALACGHQPEVDLVRGLAVSGLVAGNGIGGVGVEFGLLADDAADAGAESAPPGAVQPVDVEVVQRRFAPEFIAVVRRHAVGGDADEYGIARAPVMGRPAPMLRPPAPDLRRPV